MTGQSHSGHRKKTHLCRGSFCYSDEELRGRRKSTSATMMLTPQMMMKEARFRENKKFIWKVTYLMSSEQRWNLGFHWKADHSVATAYPPSLSPWRISSCYLLLPDVGCLRELCGLCNSIRIGHSIRTPSPRSPPAVVPPTCEGPARSLLPPGLCRVNFR